jgi:outer membrane protein
MKNGLLLWNVLLTLGLAALLVLHFTGKSKQPKQESAVAGDSASANKNFRIAYFDMDSVEANFETVKQKKTDILKKENAINGELEGLSKKFQQEYMRLQQEAQSGRMSAQDQEAAAQKLKNMDDQMKNRKAVLDQEYQELVMRANKEMKTTIEDFLKEYNKTHGYSYITVNEPGLFYFRDTAYNITADVVKGLNEFTKKKSN